jgi:hypothetical protein
MNVEVLWTKKREFELKMDVGGRLWMGYAGGGIRTLNPSVCHFIWLYSSFHRCFNPSIF